MGYFKNKMLLMRKFYCIIILFFISTGYLFSQTEENKIISVDTVITVDTVVVTKADTIVITNPINEPEAKKDFLKHDFYNDYLPSLPKTSPVKDTLAIKKEKIGIILAEILITSSDFKAFSPRSLLDVLFPDISLSIKAPISGSFHIIIKDWMFFSESIYQSYHLMSLMLGCYGTLDKDKKIIGEIAAGAGLIGFGSMPGAVMLVDVNVYYKIYKNALLSCGIDYIPSGHDFGTFFIFSLGLGITY